MIFGACSIGKIMIRAADLSSPLATHAFHQRNVKQKIINKNIFQESQKIKRGQNQLSSNHNPCDIPLFSDWVMRNPYN